MPSYSVYAPPKVTSPKISPVPPLARLTFVQGDQKGEVVFLRSRLSYIGRRGDITLRDELASRRHMQIFFNGNEYIVEDLYSSNGTYLNEKSVHHPTTLHHGDVIRVGKTRFLFEL
jgi:pSer/pThr/pTyr-binding forkhead associated (FHA) protein